MTDARNVYPRLCWGCLSIIKDVEHDHALLNYGGWCSDCHKRQAGEMPRLRNSLQGYTEYMNDIEMQDMLVRTTGENNH